MKKTTLFSVIAILFLLCLTPAQARKVVVNLSDKEYGILPNDKQTNTASRLHQVLCEIQKSVQPGDKVVIRFAKGRYDFHPSDAVKREYYVSNHDQNQPKTIGLCLENWKNLTIDGNGAQFIYHGQMLPIALVNSENVTFKNFSIDFEHPHIAQVEVLKNSETDGITFRVEPWVNYRIGENKGKSDDVLATELIELAECGATLCDVMGDYFDACEGELTMNEKAVEKQMKLIGELHARGAEVLMSSHVLKYTPAERVLEIALEHQRRGADICKIVTSADTMEQQIENLRIVNMLKEKLDIPFLFLSGGESRILRRLSASLGSCMSLCVYEHDELSTPLQPRLCDMKKIRDLI